MSRTWAAPFLALVILGVVLDSAAALRPLDGKQVMVDPLTCVKQNATADCDDLVGCTWCVSTTIGTGCYPVKVAKILPKKMFTCDKPVEVAVKADECDKRAEDDCIAPDCVWCTSAAVGGGCYTPAQAKLLPSAIFHCKTAPSTQ